MDFSVVLEYVCVGLCGLFGLIHVIYSIISNFRLNKKIDRFCSECGLPVFEGDSHLCPKEIINSLGNIIISSDKGISGSLNASITSEQLSSLKYVLNYLREEYSHGD